MRNTIALCAAASLLITASCNHDRGASTTTTTGAVIVSSEDAVQRLTAGRCQREMDCNNIGTGKSYDDYPACEREVSHDLRPSLQISECPYGIREPKVDECLQELKNEQCGNPFDHVSRLATCRSSRLCIR